MKNLYESQYSQVSFVNTGCLIIQKWLNKSEILTDKKFQYEMLHLLFQVEKVSPRILLIDLTNFFYVISNEMQVWINVNINVNILKNNVEKLAFIKSKNEISEISVDLTLNDISNRNMTYQFFNDEVSATNWLLQY